MCTEKKGLSAINYTIIMSQGWKGLVHINTSKGIKYAISLAVFCSVFQLKYSTPYKILQIISFYGIVSKLSDQRSLEPDTEEYLSIIQF